jgi:hypothetical protein
VRLYEINTRVHCTTFDQITDAELAELSQLGFDAVWMMGVWRISEGARTISKITSEDFEGSPYAVPLYEINRELGGRSRFARLVKRARGAGLSVIVDFVSNHMAVDSPWITQRADLFVRSDTKARTQSTNEFFLARSGDAIAFGRDPYFSPWNDTAQLDYSNSALRTKMIEVLKHISQIADGVRCDMAMLILRDCFRQLWYPLLPQSLFDQKMPSETRPSTRLSRSVLPSHSSPRPTGIGNASFVRSALICVTKRSCMTHLLVTIWRGLWRGLKRTLIRCAVHCIL